MGAPFDPERPNTHSRISQLIATQDSYLIGVEPKSSLEFFMNIYPLRIDLQLTPCVRMEVIPTGQKMACLRMVGSVATWTADASILVSTTLA